MQSLRDIQINGNYMCKWHMCDVMFLKERRATLLSD